MNKLDRDLQAEANAIQRTNDIEQLANDLYEGAPALSNLAEKCARKHGKAEALSIFAMMGPEVWWFWNDIARRIIEHSEKWERNDGSACVLNEEERLRLRELMMERRA